MKSQPPRMLLQTLGFNLVLIMLNIAATQSANAETHPVWFNCLTRERFSPEKQIWCDRLRTLQNTALIVPTSLDSDPEYTTATLNNGRYQQENGQFFVELVNEQNWLTFGDINGDDKVDAAVIFGVALDPNGREMGTYLTTVLDVDDEAQAITPIKLGERIMLNAPIAIQNNQIIVPFLTQTEVIDRVYQIDMTLRELPRDR